MPRIQSRWLVGAAALALAMVACSNGGETLPPVVAADFEVDSVAGADAAPFLYRPVDRVAPEFTLINQDQVLVSLADYRGSWVVMDWVFTNCVTFCPLLTGDMLTLRDGLGEELGAEVNLLTITFDPTRDSATALKAYAAQVGASSGGWSWLTGTEAETGAVAASYGIAYEPSDAVNGIPQFDHTNLMVMIGPDGRERHRYLGTGWSTDALERIQGELANQQTAAPAPTTPPTTAADEVLPSFLEGTLVLPWEEWELTEGVSSQDLYQFSGQAKRRSFLDLMIDEAEARGALVTRQILASMDSVTYPTPEGGYISIGYTLNLAVVIEAATIGDAFNALYVIDSEWCCSSPG